MRLIKRSLKNQGLVVGLTSALYVLLVVILLVVTFSTSWISYPLEAYIYATDPLDFFFALFTSVPFGLYTYFLVRDGFLQNVQSRMAAKKYLAYHVLTTVAFSVFLVSMINYLAIVLSYFMARSFGTTASGISLGSYFLGQWQMNQPLLFGIIWSLLKGLAGGLICLLGQICAIYIDNFFLALMFPFIFIQLSNFVLAILGLSQYSFVSTYALNWLQAGSQNGSSFFLAHSIFIFCIALIYLILRYRHEKEVL